MRQGARYRLIGNVGRANFLEHARQFIKRCAGGYHIVDNGHAQPVERAVAYECA